MFVFLQMSTPEGSLCVVHVRIADTHCSVNLKNNVFKCLAVPRTTNYILYFITGKLGQSKTDTTSYYIPKANASFETYD